MQAKTIRLLATATATLILISAGASAATVTYVTAITSAQSSTGYDSDSVLQQIGTSAGYSAVTGFASATTSVTVGQGWARGSAEASAGGDPATGSGSVQGMWVDDFTFSAPSQSGMGTATVTLNVSGSLSASSGGSPGNHAGADWNLYFKAGTVSQPFVGLGQIGASPSGVVASGDLSGGTYDVTFNFFFNVPIEIRVALNVSASATDSGSAGAQFGNTLEWGGITELRDSSGSLVGSYNLVSGSGVDWRQAVAAPAVVPLPAGFGLLCSGLLGLALAARRRRADPRQCSL